MKEFAQKLAHICDHYIAGGECCGCGNQPGFTRSTFGKEYKHLCRCPMQFIDPDAVMLNNMKKLTLMYKND